MAFIKLDDGNFGPGPGSGRLPVYGKDLNNLVAVLNGELGPNSINQKRSVKVFAPVADVELTTLPLSVKDSGGLILIGPITDALTIMLPPATVDNIGVFYTFVISPQGEASADAVVMTPDEKLIVGSVTAGGEFPAVITADGESGTIFFMGSSGGLSPGDTITVTCMDTVHWFASAGITAAGDSIVFAGE